MAALVPPGVVTSTLAAPALPAGGVVQVRLLPSLATETPVAAVPPIVTLVALAKLAPLIVTLVPPLAVPLVADILLTVGGSTKVNKEFVALVPPGVVTSTLAVPALSAGVVQVI